jgi:polyhydroxyalkanoate synthesis regulator phasin
VENVLLREYIYSLRRRIEVQAVFAEALTEELTRLRKQLAGIEEKTG